MQARRLTTAWLAAGVLAASGALVLTTIVSPAPAHGDGPVDFSTPPSEPPPWRPGSFKAREASGGVKMYPEPDHGFVLSAAAETPVGAWHRVPDAHSGNSLGVPNFVLRTGVGRYDVWFPGLPPEGAVLVTATGAADGGAYCKAVRWTPSPPAFGGIDATVACFDVAGAAVNTTFVVSYSHPGADAATTGGYVRAGRPTEPSYRPSEADQHNSAGGSNTVVRTAPGSYVVHLPGLGGAGGGHAQVTAYGDTRDWCKVERWDRAGADLSVGVRCFSRAGAAADAPFSLIFVRDTNVLLAPAATASGYVLADQPETATYPPSNAYVLGGGAVVAERVGTGSYRLRLPVDLARAMVHVVAFGATNVRCKPVSWTGADGVRVGCHQVDGSLVDSAYLVAFAGLA